MVDIKKGGKKEGMKKELVKDKPINSLKKSLNEVKSSIILTYQDYFKNLTPRLKLIDIFLVFLVLLAILQFIYVILIGNFPFNAFLGGFISCVAQFVLTVSLRLQVNNQDKSNQLSFSPETSFGDYIFASLILHFVIFHFIN